ncbi:MULTISPECIES: IS3 family transposase [unclassified Aurantimonas]|uniref:IS3 family transposase n=1 Tax=unclassified Aurantimonas TaxID=2638230 RepID=UPI002E175268|nr:MULTISPECIES: IS3 family transposase [unclassified Aurantimonas]MEC5293370.1 IS3 family transposase [Aurantimonas sp. C2-3-R2]MEC5414456.1 IS3 family transposase [Aurantimonas sp. C2-4-R8]
MKDGVRARYTLEFKQEAVRLVRGGERISAAARTLGVSAQSLDNWVKAEAAGRLRDVRGKALTTEQMEIARLKAELSRVRMERDIPKKSDGILREGVAVRYAFVERHRGIWPIAVQCRVLQVSASGYHQHRLRQAADVGPNQPHRRLSDAALAVHIKAVFAEMKGAYGWPRIWRELAARGIRAGKERVRRMMKTCGLRARGKRRFKATTNSAHDLPVAPNLLARNFVVGAPNKVWTGDITYIWTEEGWLYLAVVIDLFNRQVVGFAMGKRMTRTLVMDALRMAWFRRHPAPALIFHSDRGSQYASNDYRKLLRDFKMESSMSRKGDCWDNAVTETLFGSLKVERIHGMRFGTRRLAKDEVIDWIAFYNHRRLHSTLGYTSPMAFEQKWLASQINMAA